jgi:hypothetical protein
MKKLLWITMLFALCAVGFVAAQEGPGASAGTMLNVGNYSKLFVNSGGILSRKYINEVTDEDYNKVADLDGSRTTVDTPLEIALLSTCAGVIDVRPVEADRILPANDPKLAGKKLGAAVLKELAEIKFLDPSNTAAIGRYEGMLKFISDKNGVTRAEMQDYLKQGIAEVVDARFNTVNFRLDKGTSISYIAKLTINLKTKEYTLNYERPEIENDDKQITAPSLNALLAEMRSGANKADFDQGCIDRISTKNADILAVRLERTGKDPRADLTAILTTFYLNPTNQTVYGAVRDVNVFYTVASSISNDLITREMYELVGSAYMKALATLSPELAQRVINDSRGRTSVTLTVEVRNRLRFD